MKLLTLNCHAWQEENTLEKIKYIAKVIDENDYDVIALQEINQSIDSKRVYENIKEDNFALLIQRELQSLGNLNYEFFWEMSHIGYKIYEEGVCIMTKLPIKRRESFFATISNDTNYWKSRNIIKTTLDYEGKDMTFYSCHLGWWGDEEEPFTHQIDSIIDSAFSDEVVFLMGDFNNSAYKKDEGYDYILSKGMYDTFTLAKEIDEGITVKGNIAGWDKNKEDLRIDIIFTNQNISVKKSKVIFNNINKNIVSDHYGVEIEF